MERTRTIPSVGFGESNKISSINPELKTELSSGVENNKITNSTTGIESSRIGIFISPTFQCQQRYYKGTWWYIWT